MSSATNDPLTQSQIETYLTTGILVVPLLTPNELLSARQGLRRTLLRYGVDTSTDATLEATGHNLTRLSSTNGSGGVLDVFYPPWKFDVALNPRLFAMTSQLWREAYCHSGERYEDLDPDDRWKWHPFEGFDTRRGYAYVDRIGFRIPTELAEALGRRQSNRKEEGGAETMGGGKRRKRPIQRSLTPHLDCCPEKFGSAANKSKFRPIQCMVSLSDNSSPSTGGFEAVPGFHREFDKWASERPPSIIERKVNGRKEREEQPPPCVGEYTHIRPAEDTAIFSRIQHVPIMAGDVVFWDNRIPHANAYRHLGKEPRVVVYCSFLPDVCVNRKYTEMQLEDFRKRRRPKDQWIEVAGGEGHPGSHGKSTEIEDMDGTEDYQFDELSRKLMGMSRWDERH